MSLIEAMALGRPVIATAAGGPAEIVEDGRSGLLVPHRDPPALARAMLSLARDRARCRDMGVEARRRAQRKFEVGALVAEQEAYLANLAQRAIPPATSS